MRGQAVAGGKQEAQQRSSKRISGAASAAAAAASAAAAAAAAAADGAQAAASKPLTLNPLKHMWAAVQDARDAWNVSSASAVARGRGLRPQPAGAARPASSRDYGQGAKCGGAVDYQIYPSASQQPNC